ncbi:hypothetical protein Vadar_001311 [Vaccinium darrowii]|uniref:Uncharacterized protein n=1 Tax=Vaccinium darrowii TaxID=229202 RepID=A0ACB7YS24_9ERIC|nr:hypothetical protein Vadar_001311 [Vaccinium darrowii]
MRDDDDVISYDEDVISVLRPLIRDNDDVISAGAAAANDVISGIMNFALFNGTVSQQQATASKDNTIILDGASDKKAVEERWQQFNRALPTSYESEKLPDRLAKFSGGIAVLKIGGASETEISEKKDRVKDALNATNVAVEEVTVPSELSNADAGFYSHGNRLLYAGVEAAVVIGKLLEEHDPDLQTLPHCPVW